MSTTLTAVNFSFLTSGPGYSLRLPSDFETLPELSSPVLNGHGGRSFDFVSTQRDFGLADEGVVFLRALTAKDGHTVELYQRQEPPPVWWLRWSLRNGAIYTHLREQDGAAFADVTVASVSIVEDPSGGTPFVLLSRPLEFGASANPGFQELAIYFSASRGAMWTVALQRPGFVSSGSVLTSSGSEPAVRAGTRYGIDVQVTSGTSLADAQDLMSTVLGSLAER
jgi:hypothetical protein